jgi:hypothetical protein
MTTTIFLRTHRSSLVLFAVGIALFAVACGDSPTQPPPELEGGVLATFTDQTDTFHVWTDRSATIEQLMALDRGEASASIPNGRLRRGPGPADHNAPWSWHLAPQTVEMVEVAMEVCDGAPSFVESELDYWMENVGRYCPWNAQLVQLVDFR